MKISRCVNSLEHLSVAKGGGVVQRYQASVVPGVDVGSILEEEVHHVFTTETWRHRVNRAALIYQACAVIHASSEPSDIFESPIVPP